MATPINNSKVPALSVEARNDHIMSIAFGNGETLQLDADTLTPEIQRAAMMHGLKQKLVDAAAIGRDNVTGRSATNDDKYAAVREVFDRITGANGMSATWNKVRDGSASVVAGGLLVGALMQLSGKERAEIVAYLAPMTNEQKAALRKNPKVAAIIEEIKLANAKADKGVDTDAMLAGLLGDIGDDETDETDDTDDTDEEDADDTEENDSIALD